MDTRIVIFEPMKIICLVLLLSLLSISCFSQTGTPQPPYQRFPTFPPVKLLKADSVYFTKTDLPKKSPVLLMLFNPQCNHCQHETEELIKNIDQFKKISIVMATTMHMDSMRSFSQRYGLEKYENITVGRDIQYFLPSFFMINNLPFLAFYNRNKQLISAFEGALPIPQIVTVFKD